MLNRLYINNFRCLVNFSFEPENVSAMLFIGKNGSGKSSVASALTVFQQIGRGVNRVRELIQPSDFFCDDTRVPLRLELTATLADKIFEYQLVFELPENFNEIRIQQEHLKLNGQVLNTRQHGEVSLPKRDQSESKFIIDWHSIALPLIQLPQADSPLSSRPPHN